MSKRFSFRVGRVTGYIRGRIWYLRYVEDGRRRQPRVGPDRDAARQLAAQVNAELEVGAPTHLSFTPITIIDLQRNWLEHHEHLRRSSPATVNRYRTATQHLIWFTTRRQPVALASHFGASHAEAFVRYLREIEVAPNGHAHSAKRRLRDKGVVYVLETCRTMFNYAMKRRHLSPYADNPFTAVEIDRIPITDAKPVVLLSAAQEQVMLDAADEWLFPILLTLSLTGMRPGELTRLLLPTDLDLDGGLVHISNKPELGWQTKTRNERQIPLVPELIHVLRWMIGSRVTGPVFLRQQLSNETLPPLARLDRQGLAAELAHRAARRRAATGADLAREEHQGVADRLWVEAGAVVADRIRVGLARIVRAAGLPEVTTPKTLRHMFATAMQDGNVDPLIRSRLMGHTAAGASGGGLASGGLGMTGVYTHCRPETVRQQLAAALSTRPAIEVARRRLAARASRV